MNALWKGLSAISFLALPLSRRADRRYRLLPRLQLRPVDGVLPSLSIIVPARNEAENLQELLPTLQRLKYDGETEIIVVDDQSTDETASVAAKFNTRLITAPPLPAGWRGKPHACHIGAAAASGEWLLFTDADTRHEVNSAASAVSTCLDLGLDGMSLFLGQQQGVWGDPLVLTAAYGGLFAGLTPQAAVLNGQYIMLRTAVYRKVNGFAAVRAEMIEDMALANTLHKAGFNVPIYRGEAAASVRMYANFHQMWQGLARLGAGSLKWSGGGLLSAAFITTLMSPLVALTGFLLGKLRWTWPAATWLAVFGASRNRIKKTSHAIQDLFIPFGAIIVQMAATIGLISKILGRNIQWKGRAV